MTAFEFYTVLLSFIISLGIAVLLGGLARLIQEGARVTYSWAHALWALMIFNLQIIFWLKSWSYHGAYGLDAKDFFPPLILAIVAFLCCALVTPHVPLGGSIDLKEFHAREGRRYAVAATLFLALSVVQGLVMGSFDSAGRPQSSLSGIAGGAVGGALTASALVLRRPWAQIGVPALNILLSIPYYASMLG